MSDTHVLPPRSSARPLLAHDGPRVARSACRFVSVKNHPRSWPVWPPRAAAARCAMKKQLAKQKRGVFNTGASGCGGGSGEVRAVLRRRLRCRQQRDVQHRASLSSCADAPLHTQPIDKRGKELFGCPFCDRVFVQKDRLTQHVSKHHPDEATGAAPAAAAAAASPAAPAAPAAPVRVTHKAPRTILQEFLQKAKKVPARYVPREAEGGAGWICKARGGAASRPSAAAACASADPGAPCALQVVLPDKYKPDSDVVLWMEDAAPDKEEAQQRAAVVALARVASNLPLQRLLSTSYKDRFVQEEGRERERQERAKAAAEAAARRRAAADRPQPKLQTVYMSEEKRRMVEAALAALRVSEGVSAAELGEKVDGDDGSSDDDGEAPPAAPPPPALRQRLLSMGFAAADVDEALSQPRCRVLAPALDWCVPCASVARALRAFGCSRVPSGLATRQAGAECAGGPAAAPIQRRRWRAHRCRASCHRHRRHLFIRAGRRCRGEG